MKNILIRLVDDSKTFNKPATLKADHNDKIFKYGLLL